MKSKPIKFYRVPDEKLVLDIDIKNAQLITATGEKTGTIYYNDKLSKQACKFFGKDEIVDYPNHQRTLSIAFGWGQLLSRYDYELWNKMGLNDD